MHRASTKKVRREEVDGDPMLVVPTVALRTGVYQCANCEEPAFYDADVFARIPESWNDRPITLSHPQRDGLFVSAGSEDVWRKDGLGRVRNARRDGDKLVMEAWIDLTKADEVGDAANDLVDALEGGEQIDVSVGAFIDSVAHPGVHQGQAYGRRQLNYFPDHVALLPGQTGACSWEDGCGAPRVNGAIQENMMVLQANLPLETTTASSCPCGGEGGECTCDDGPKTAEILASSLSFSINVIGDVAKRQILHEPYHVTGILTYNATSAFFEMDADNFPGTHVDITNSRAKEGPDTRDTTPPTLFDCRDDLATGIAKCNVFGHNNLSEAQRPTILSGAESLTLEQTATLVTETLAFEPRMEVSSINPEQLEASLLPIVGATKPARDALDQRIIDEVASRTGTKPDDPTDVVGTGLTGGYPTLAAGTASTDTDGDGMPDDWELAFEGGTFWVNIFDAWGDRDSDGWTNLEEYLNFLAGDISDPRP